MNEQTTERFELRAEHLISRFKQLLHEGNVRRVTIKQGETTIAVFPLTAGVVGAVIAPALAAIGALAAMLSECTIEVERTGEPARPATEPAEEGAPQAPPL
ncbi:MAG: DUF4342 domain-containing protein [Dehalococcoidia bacterium]|nr:DUF4342 domain-containing protein [Dehalococcoidia bacterium]